MPRGRQYYDPIVQVPGIVQGEQDLSRVEVFQDETLKWWGRQVGADGSLTGRTLSDFSHENLLKHVNESWPDLTVYELRSEAEDSTWEGHGPSPRLWQNSSPGGAVVAPPVDVKSGPPHVGHAGAGDEPIPPAVQAAMDEGWEGSDADYFARAIEAEQQSIEGQAPLRILPIDQPGLYVRLSDITDWLELAAVTYEIDKNPSAAMALREAVDALKEIG